MSKRKPLTKRIGRYMIEIIIIILGITISFALNEWNNSKNDGKAYQEHLQNLNVDMEVDLKQLTDDVNSYTRISKAIQNVIQYDPENEDSIYILIRGVGELLTFVEFLPNDNTYRTISGTGGFSVFENKNLIKELNQLYRYDISHIDMIGRSTRNLRASMLMPELYSKINFEDATTFPVINTDVKAFLRDQKVRNILIDYDGSCSASISATKTALAQLKKTKALIEKELKK